MSLIDMGSKDHIRVTLGLRTTLEARIIPAGLCSVAKEKKDIRAESCHEHFRKINEENK